MTSFIIQSHVDRKLLPAWDSQESCTFCRIISNELPASRIFETDKVIAILDIMPLRRGHSLVIPKAHYARLSDLPPEVAAATGEAVTTVAAALRHGLNINGLNVVCNEVYAQAVPHVHYHIIPAPLEPENTRKTTDHRVPFTKAEMHQIEFEGRDELDDEEAIELLSSIKSKL